MIKEDSQTNSLKLLPLTEENIGFICGRFSLDYAVAMNVIFIRTAYTSWRVYYRENLVTEVFHENYKTKNAVHIKKKKYAENFHKQEVGTENFYEVVRYIYYHDKHYVNRMRKESRIEILYKKIAVAD